jgi:HPt (histidine-containing phosphotransfer) domain-containing protein
MSTKDIHAQISALLVEEVEDAAAHAGSARTLTTRATAAQETLSLSVLDDLDTDDDDSREFALSLMDAYGDEASSQVAVIRRARTSRDAGLLKTTLHSLKGSSLTMGALPLAGLCAGMEQRVATGSIDDLSPQLLTDIESEFTRVLAALAIHRDRITFARAS